jgi:hypothetical protein
MYAQRQQRNPNQEHLRIGCASQLPVIAILSIIGAYASFPESRRLVYIFSDRRDMPLTEAMAIR